MIIQLLQHIIFMIIVRLIIALVTQMTVHRRLQIQEDVMVAVAGEIKKALCIKGLFYDLR